jgi:hypothetical protein
MSANLESLKTEIEAIGEKIKTLKTASGDKDEIATAIQDLLNAKKSYADNNNGIGFDGKPYEEPMSKAQKKAKAKAEKDAAAAAGGGGDAAAKEVRFHSIPFQHLD